MSDSNKQITVLSFEKLFGYVVILFAGESLLSSGFGHTLLFISICIIAMRCAVHVLPKIYNEGEMNEEGLTEVARLQVFLT